MTGNTRKHVTESSIQDEAPGGPVHLEASLRVTTKCQRRLELAMNPNVIGEDPAVRRVVKFSRLAGDEAPATHLDTVQHIRQTAGTKSVVVSPAKRAHTIPFSVDPGPVAFGYWKVVSADAVRISTQCEEHV